MPKLVPAIVLATIAFAGTAIAQTDMPPPPGTGGPGGPGGGGMGMLMRADANGDGIITRDEAIAAADRQFDRIDANHDGKITPDEMAAWRDARMARRGGDAPVPPPGGGRGMPGMGRHADPDGDGVITRDEWRARAMARFDRMDANHDGKIDRTEIANMREMQMERHQGHGMPDDGTPPTAPAPPPGQ